MDADDRLYLEEEPEPETQAPLNEETAAYVRRHREQDAAEAAQRRAAMLQRLRNIPLRDPEPIEEDEEGWKPKKPRLTGRWYPPEPEPAPYVPPPEPKPGPRPLPPSLGGPRRPASPKFDKHERIRQSLEDKHPWQNRMNSLRHNDILELMGRNGREGWSVYAVVDSVGNYDESGYRDKVSKASFFLCGDESCRVVTRIKGTILGAPTYNVRRGTGVSDSQLGKVLDWRVIGRL